MCARLRPLDVCPSVQYAPDKVRPIDNYGDNVRPIDNYGDDVRPIGNFGDISRPKVITAPVRARCARFVNTQESTRDWSSQRSSTE